MDSGLIAQLATTMELIGGRSPSEPVIRMMIAELDQHDPQLVHKAISRCSREVKGHLALSDIVCRIDDGRPDANTAWAMVPSSEDDSVVWTAETAWAYGKCCGLINDGDKVAARMAFIESYKNRVESSRSNGIPIEWVFSPGFDKTGRVAELSKAYDQGLLPIKIIMKQLPHNDAGENFRNKIESDLMLLEKHDNGECGKDADLSLLTSGILSGKTLG